LGPEYSEIFSWKPGVACDLLTALGLRMHLDPLSRPFLFVQGKGGVGKTTLAHALAHLASKSHRTLLVSIEDPLRKPFDLQKLSPTLDHLNNEALSAFEEYAGLKIGAPKLVQIFLQNRFMQYVAKAAPGIRELVLLGKIWHERHHYERIIVDMPATGHGITLFQSLFNWGALFGSGPLSKDAEAMIETFSDASQVGHVIVSLPEEMPLIESLELRSHLQRIFPSADPLLIANRVFPAPARSLPLDPSDLPFSRTALEHATKKASIEAKNLESWKSEAYARIPFFPPSPSDPFGATVKATLDLLPSALAEVSR
jgi:hypothetical protein